MKLPKLIANTRSKKTTCVCFTLPTMMTLNLWSFVQIDCDVLDKQKHSLLISSDKLTHRLKDHKSTNLQSRDDMSVLANVLEHVKGDDNKVCDLEANDDYLTQVKPKHAVQFLEPFASRRSKIQRESAMMCREILSPIHEGLAVSSGLDASNVWRCAGHGLDVYLPRTLSSSSSGGEHASKAICSSGWTPKWILWKSVELITDLFTLLVMTRSRVTWILRKIQIISLICADTTCGRPPSWKIWTRENFCAVALTMPRRVLRHISQPISGFSALPAWVI